MNMKLSRNYEIHPSDELSDYHFDQSTLSGRSADITINGKC